MRVVSAMVGIVAAARLAVAQDAVPKLQFEVASIRPFVPKPGSAGIAAPQNPEHLVISAALRYLLMRAYGLEIYQLEGPDSLSTVWTIAANAAPGTTQAQQNLMLQNLIEERFHLTFHHEMKALKVYNLVIAKGGLKLKESIPTEGCSGGAASVTGKPCKPESRPVGIAKASGEGPPFMGGGGPSGVLTARNLTLSAFAINLRYLAGEIVIDKTGLEGTYDIRAEYATVDRNGRPYDDSPRPTLEDALAKQLGLKLEATKSMIDVMVIEHVDAMPTEN
jgi:uncharacterized protein (TIGR03435 family)